MLKKRDTAYWCLVDDQGILLINHDLPCLSAEALGIDPKIAHHIGEFNHIPVYAIYAPPQLELGEYRSLRDLLFLPSPLFNLASRAMELGYMQKSQRFCAQCGGALRFTPDENAMRCQQCHMVHYPRLSPCIIVAVRKDESILLAQHPRHKNGMYTVIAGFVEAGETLEQCVAREVFEETGIVVDNIQYIGSQPWAFPSNLMMAFVADYQNGELKPDYAELTDAIWAHYQQLPPVAPKGTIARELIEQTLLRIKQGKDQQN